MPDLEETMKDWLLHLEGQLGAGHPRCVSLRKQIEAKIDARIKSKPPLWDAETATRILYGE